MQPHRPRPDRAQDGRLDRVRSDLPRRRAGRDPRGRGPSVDLHRVAAGQLHEGHLRQHRAPRPVQQQGGLVGVELGGLQRRAVQVGVGQPSRGPIHQGRADRQRADRRGERQRQEERQELGARHPGQVGGPPLPHAAPENQGDQDDGRGRGHAPRPRRAMRESDGRLERPHREPVGPGHDPVAFRVDPDEVEVAAEPDVRRGPEVGGRGLAEDAGVGFERLGVPVVVLNRLRRPAAGRAVMERRAEDAAAELVPVAPGVDEGGVPRLVDGVRGRDRVAGDDGQEREPLVLLDHAPGVAEGPAVLPRQPSRER